MSAWSTAVIARMGAVGLTTTALARKASLSGPGVSKALRGNPTVATMERIAAALGCVLRIELVDNETGRIVEENGLDVELFIAA